MRLFFLAVLLFTYVAVLAQSTPIIFDHYGLADGLTTKSTNGIAKTTDGMMWITSEEGLIRFDSKKFVYYTHSASDSNSLGNNRTYEIAVDNKNNIWVKTANGLDKLNPETGKFTHCTIPVKGKLTNDFFAETIFYDSRTNTVWLSVRNGVFINKNGSSNFEAVKKDEESKSIYMNDFGSIVIIVTKSNLIRVVDFLGKSLVFTINEFKESQKTSKILILKQP